uniref:Ig-like domain-containing protein n=1 Tax=Acrobeloides nanus TaxID=290746 RepID=A0A914CK86_9BILA
MVDFKKWNFNILVFILCYLLKLCHGLGPPKLEEQPPEEVWFQANTISSPHNKFSLKCSASGDPEIFEWRKNDEPFDPDGKRVVWLKPSQSGTILFLDPQPQDQGYYQCFISNIFGTAVSTRVNVRQGVLDHFPPRKLRVINVDEGDSLTLNCDAPYGMPKPSIFWLYRSKNEMLVFESIKREHIALDPDGKLHFATVSAFDGRENLIYECAATSPAMQGEYRAGDHVQLVVEPVTSK